MGNNHRNHSGKSAFSSGALFSISDCETLPVWYHCGAHLRHIYLIWFKGSTPAVKTLKGTVNFLTWRLQKACSNLGNHNQNQVLLEKQTIYPFSKDEVNWKEIFAHTWEVMFRINWEWWCIIRLTSVYQKWSLSKNILYKHTGKTHIQLSLAGDIFKSTLSFYCICYFNKHSIFLK